MNKLSQHYDSTLLSIMDELSANGKYKLKNHNGFVRIYNINSLLYIPFDDFVIMAEEIIQMTIPREIIPYIYTKFYIENVENFIPNVTEAICTNFLDGNSFSSLKEYTVKMVVFLLRTLVLLPKVVDFFLLKI